MIASEIKEANAGSTGYINIINRLLDGGAEVNAENEDKWTALILAATEGNVNVVKRLLQVEGIKIEAKNKFGKSAFFNACEFGCFECVNVLFDHGADIDALSNRGATPIMLAAVKKHKEIVSFLLDKGADLSVEIPPKNGRDNVSGFNVFADFVFVINFTFFRY